MSNPNFDDKVVIPSSIAADISEARFADRFDLAVVDDGETVVYKIGDWLIELDEIELGPDGFLRLTG